MTRIGGGAVIEIEIQESIHRPEIYSYYDGCNLTSRRSWPLTMHATLHDLYAGLSQRLATDASKRRDDDGSVATTEHLLWVPLAPRVPRGALLY